MENILTDPLFQALFNSPVPRIIVRADAPHFTIVTNNDAHAVATNLVGKNIAGKSVWEIFNPEDAGGDGGDLLMTALNEAEIKNETVLMPPFRYDMSARGKEGMEEKWWQLEIMPVGGNTTKPEYLLTTTHDITDQVMIQRGIEERASREQELNEQLARQNQELQASRDDLKHLTGTLEQTIVNRTRRLTQSEAKFRTIVEQSPVAIAVLEGKSHIVDAVNSAMLKLWGKDEKVLGKPIVEALPEMEGQPYPEILHEVFRSGRPHYGDESAVELFRNKQMELGYFIFINYPLKDENGLTHGVIVVASEVTDQVNSRKELEKVYEQVSLSKKAAQLGTFDMDLIQGTMEWDARCRELFGISHQNEVSYENDFLKGLYEEDRERIIEIISKLFDKSISNGDYDVEYRTVGSEDGKIRWVRAKGKVFFDHLDKPLRFIGSVLDITDQKENEQRKNDFIGMVSHELKTPLTSLKGNIQILTRHAEKLEDKRLSNVLSNSEKHINKMVAMIHGFLDLSRLESGKYKLYFQDVELGDLIEQEVKDYRINQQNLKITFKNGESTHIYADPVKISLVISNLLSNAIKYSPDHHPILITTEIRDDHAIIRIKDEGIGIPEEELPKLFDRYYRAEHLKSKYISGFGIGLYICSEIVKLHHGKIWVESKLHQGSTFAFSLPLTSSLK